jgi:hypothetical protein
MPRLSSGQTSFQQVPGLRPASVFSTTPKETVTPVLQTTQEPVISTPEKKFYQQWYFWAGIGALVLIVALFILKKK